MLDDAVILFGVLAFWGVILGAITASIMHFINKE